MQKKIFILTLTISMFVTFNVCGQTQKNAIVTQTTENNTIEADPMAQMTEKLQRAVNIYGVWSENGKNPFMNLLQDNVEHWTDYFYSDEPVPTFQNGNSGYQVTNSTYAAICNSYDEYINRGVDTPQDYIQWMSTFESETAILEQWCNGKTENISDVKEMYMLGAVRYAATLAQNKYILEDATIDGGTYTWNGKTSAYTAPILFIGSDGTKTESGLVAIFDVNLNLLNIIYIGEGSDTNIMQYSYGVADFLQRKEM